MERDLNTVRSEFEGFKADVNGRLNWGEEWQVRSKGQQALVLEKLDTLINWTSGTAAPTNPTAKEEKLDLTKQPETNEYFEMASQIQGRRDHDKALEQIPSAHESRAKVSSHPACCTNHAYHSGSGSDPDGGKIPL